MTPVEPVLAPVVLLVDDEASIRELYSIVLKSAGFRVATAATGSEAVERVREVGAAVLVLDANLPDMTGEEVLDRLRADPDTDHVSVLIVTGDDATERRVAGLDRGANDYLTKPVHPRELVARVQNQVRVRDLWIGRLEAAMSLRRRLAADLTQLDAGQPLAELAKGLAAALRMPLEVTGLLVTPVVAGGLGRPIGAGSERTLAALGEEVHRSLAGPVVDRLAGSAQVHVPLESSDGVFAVLSVRTDAAADRALPALLDLRAQLSMLVYPALSADSELLRTRGAIDAMVNDQSIVPVFQPIVELVTRRIVGFEGLSRFPDAVAPDEWFRHAGSLGLGPQLEVAAIRALLAAATVLPDDAFLTLNVSVSTLVSTDLSPILSASTRRLLVEITEHDLVRDYDMVSDAVERLDGVGLCVDDAGSGYASLRHVFELRPDLVKLDRHWIAGLDGDPARQSLVRGLLDFTGKLGGVLLGEGIETDAEYRSLLDLGVRVGQGYLFGRPAPARHWALTDPGSDQRTR